MLERGSHSDYNASERSCGSSSASSAGGYSLWFSVIVVILFVVTEISKIV